MQPTHDALAPFHEFDIGQLALEVALAGHHPLLLWGPPGAGKTTLSRSSFVLLPDFTREVGAEVAEIHGRILARPPIRVPHFTASLAALIGNPRGWRPGEVTLAHGGALVIDDISEVPLACIEALGTVAQRGCSEFITKRLAVVYPARFLLIGVLDIHRRQNPARVRKRLELLRPCWDLAVRLDSNVRRRDREPTPNSNRASKPCDGASRAAASRFRSRAVSISAIRTRPRGYCESPARSPTWGIRCRVLRSQMMQ